MTPIDVKIESLIHRSFLDFQKVQNIDTLAGQLKRYAHAGYGFRLLDSIKGGHLYLFIDTNYHQFHWALKKLIRSLRTKS